jgi:cytochrome c-type biogenesis protein CcmH
MTLWLLLAFITAAAVVFTVAPLHRARSAPSSVSHEVELYKKQIQEIDQDMARGVLTAAEADDVRRETSRRLLAAADGESSQGSATHNRVNVVTVAMAGFITATGLGVYLSVGSPGLRDQPLAARLESPVEGSSLEAMVAKVEARLRTHPEDGAGWNVIAPIYLRQQRFDDAANAFGKAIALIGETPERLAGFAEASMLANDGVALPAARSALQKALTARPDLLRARFFLALADENQGDTAAARTGYETILKAETLNPDWRRAIEAKLAALNGAPQAAVPAGAAERQAMIENMVKGLADRLNANGGEVREWMRLVRAYAVLGKQDDARAAAEKARAQFAGDLDALKQINDFITAIGLKS